MDNQLGILDQAFREFSARVDAIPADGWDGPTPATEWTVRDLVLHVLDEHLWVPPLVHGHDLQAAEEVVKAAQTARDDADLKSEWHSAATASVQAFNEPGALDREVALSRGPTPCRQYADEMIFDLVVHGWDLGKAIGYPEAIPESLAEPAYEAIKGAGDLSSFGDMFAPAVSVPEDASTLDKLVAHTGRDPR